MAVNNVFMHYCMKLILEFNIYFAGFLTGVRVYLRTIAGRAGLKPQET